MTRIAPVRMMYNPRVLWFDAQDLEIPVNAPVVVSTARGTEYGVLAEPVFEATESDLANLKTELKPVVRLATEEDTAASEEAHALSVAAMPVFRELAAEESEEMRPIAVEYLLSCDKAVFYFEAESRVDFRELVRKLANRLHVRVDMRQIGSRDEARMMGGLGHCGQELCCKRLGGEFCPVSIRMAKEQDLSLNPQKISGLCGKLMCCLRYEYEAYKDFHSRSPKVGDMVNTPDGPAKVVELDVPREILTLLVQQEDNKNSKKVKIALADMVPVEEGKPNTVEPAAWEETMASQSSGGVFEASYLTNRFTTESQLGSATAVRRNVARPAGQPTGGAAAAASGAAAAAAKGGSKRTKGKQQKAAGQSAGAAEGRSSRDGRGKKQAQGSRAAAAAAPAAPAESSHRRRRGEARQVNTGVVAAVTTTEVTAAPAAASAGSLRPGHRSSGLRRSQTVQTSSAAPVEAATAQSAAKAAAKDAGSSQRSQRQRGNGKGRGNQSGSQASASAQPAQQQAKKQDRQQSNRGNGNGGRHASGNQATQSGQSTQAATAASGEAKSGSRRQPRRRTRIDSDTK